MIINFFIRDVRLTTLIITSQHSNVCFSCLRASSIAFLILVTIHLEFTANGWWHWLNTKRKGKKMNRQCLVKLQTYRMVFRHVWQKITISVEQNFQLLTTFINHKCLQLSWGEHLIGCVHLKKITSITILSALSYYIYSSGQLADNVIRQCYTFKHIFLLWQGGD